MDTEVILTLAILTFVLGGLWSYEWVCTMESSRRYQRWVEEREQVLAQLKERKETQTSDS